MSAEDAPPSPCIGLCQLNRDQVCRGCGRHIDEIAEWSYASAARKREIVQSAKSRLPEGGLIPPRHP
ncbi:MAG TPA: DUF1289 domain-containing protein [Candidatus Binatia bacterium]|nr:DUF1289 domain-containing protein [Candidatus Binatia bacterium]